MTGSDAKKTNKDFSKSVIFSKKCVKTDMKNHFILYISLPNAIEKLNAV